MDSNTINIWTQPWSDCGNYWLSPGVQQSARHKKDSAYRLTMSKISTALGRSPASFGTPEEVAKHIAGVKYIEHKPEAIERMSHGVKMEPEARMWLIENYREFSQTLLLRENQPFNCQEVGIAVPKWNPIFGASPDGLIDAEYGLEIKCPQEQMYQRLIDFDSYRKQNGHPGTYNHIYTSHYDQSQGGMAIFQRPKWIYLVYCKKTNTKYVEVIPYDHQYCQNMFNQGTNFYHQQVKPLLDANNRRPIDPSNPIYQ